jgi:gamma-glutamylcyclotransferase (GGCT)/AIG2-like uncharacterized protein YtfP
MLLFAYGTLKDPRQVAAVVGRPVTYRVIGCGTVCGVLYNVGEYPALRPSDDRGDVVHGVLLEIDDSALADLDAYEGIAEELYVRERCTVQLDDGTTAAAWIYFYNRSTSHLRRITAWPPERG